MMDNSAKKTYMDIVGIDIVKGGVVLSFVDENMTEPYTLLRDDKDESRIIPDCLAKEKGLGRWHSGENAVIVSKNFDAYLCDNLFCSALAGEYMEIEGKSYKSVELFATFLRRTLEENGLEIVHIKKLVISVFEVDLKLIELFRSIEEKLNIPSDVLTIVDHKEAFIYYTLFQNQNIFAHDVALFEHRDDRIYSYILSRDQKTRPQVVDIQKDNMYVLGDKDATFLRFFEKVFSDRLVTTVFLVGEGFSPDWMKESIQSLCKNRRVFFGDNLFSKGCCFLGRVRLGLRPFNYIYIGDHEMKKNLSLKVNDRNDLSFFTLVEAGEAWYEAKKECEVILDGTPVFECWVQSPDTRKANIQLIELKEMPKRENRTTRLRIAAKAVSDKEVRLTIKDLGFGDIAPSSGKSWEHLINMGENHG